MMDATASSIILDIDNNDFLNYIVNNNVDKQPSTLNERRSNIKYTTIPSYDFGLKEKCRNFHQPRVRRVATVEDSFSSSPRSLKTTTLQTKQCIQPVKSRRKVITIDDDDCESRLSCRVGDKLSKHIFTPRESRRASPNNNHNHSLITSRDRTQRSINALNQSKQSSAKIDSQNSNKSKSNTKLTCRSLVTSRNSKLSNREKRSVVTSRDEAKLSYRTIVVSSRDDNKWSNGSMTTYTDDNKISHRNSTRFSDVNNENLEHERKKKITPDVRRLSRNLSASPKRCSLSNKLELVQTEPVKKNACSTFHKNRSISKSPEPNKKRTHNSTATSPIRKESISFRNYSCRKSLDDKKNDSTVKHVLRVKECKAQITPTLIDAVVETENPILVDELVNTNLELISQLVDDIQKVHETKEQSTSYDSLDIPDVTLKKSKVNSSTNCNIYKEDLEKPELQLSSQNNIGKLNGPFIIGQATLTYTTKSKINIQVVGNDNLPLKTSPSCPINVVSILKKEFKSRESEKITSSQLTSHKAIESDSNYKKSSNCSYTCDSNKLVKPSDIISGLRMNNILLDSDCVTEQFRRELNFIDSFFESLQYLENFSLHEKNILCLNKSETWTNGKLDLENTDYNNFLSNLENIDDSHTMASKSLCLLNLLIRDEQRRAKNLLFVLKLREDALKDFTKSQILYLENKKKQDNTDISTLKKKQRGALLKLHHECGEMQRMRKALVALSEKRKAALIKTKKNIEVKLTNCVDVEKILSEKKKLRRSSSTDRTNTPLKCFELSSSGCDENSNKQQGFDLTTFLENEGVDDSIVYKTLEKAQPITINTTTAEKFVALDGGYLNILCQDLNRPQIFSCDKQYEVNEQAIWKILKSSESIANMSEREEHLHTVNEESSPSTARSLVDEFDEYYKDFNFKDCSSDDRSDRSQGKSEMEAAFSSESVIEHNVDSLEHLDDDDEVKHGPQAGPLPVPVGEASQLEENDEIKPLGDGEIFTPSVSASQSSSSTIASLSSPVDCEAERLKRQQIAIEREIKALEQCQLLVVREIPDKPPPPYTPPIDGKTKVRKKFAVTDTTLQQIEAHTKGAVLIDETDSFQVYVRDYCQEVLQRHQCDATDLPWEAVNLLPDRAEPDVETIVTSTANEMRELFSAVPTTSVTGLGTRKSDHIDDILFAEWKRCEPEWTTLHNDEASVKNQVFESIFQKVLLETMHDYKHTVLGVE